MPSSQSVRQLLLNRWSLQLAATVGLLAFVIGRVDLGASIEAIRDADYAWGIAALATLTLSKLIAAGRWRIYLSKIAQPPLLGLMAAYVVGTMVNLFLPLRAGDFAKIQIASAMFQIPRAALSSSVFTVEAVLDALTLLLLFLITLAILDVTVVPALVMYAFILAAGGGFIAAVLTSRFMPREMPERWPLTRLSPRAKTILAEAWPRFLDGMVTLRDRRLLVRALSLHVLEWVLRAVVLGLLGMGFALDVEPMTYLLLTIVVSLATFFPVTFLHFGTYQVVVTEVLAAAGAPRSEAFAYAVAAHALTHAWIIAMGIVAMVYIQLTNDREGRAGRTLRAIFRMEE